MFRKALLALAMLFIAAPALAQNTTCSDRPTTDSSNACANTRFVQSHANTVVVPISAYGAKCDDSTDDTLAIQNAWTAAAAIGSNVWLGGVGVGICRFTTLTMPTPTGTGKASFLTGPGAGSVQLSTNVTGTTCAITASATYGVNSYVEGAFAGFELIQRNHTQTGYGFCVSGFTKGTWRDVKFSWFFRGFSGTDTISISIINSTFLDNQIGVYGIQGTTSGPNDWNISYNKFQSNGKNAISLTRPNLANIAFNEFQSNGYNFGQAPTGTIDLVGPAGFASSVIANVINNYFEGNVGTAEVRVDQNSVADIAGTYNINNNTFIRITSGGSGLALGIYVLNSGTGTARSIVNVGGNNFYDDTGVSAGFLWISAQTSATTNYQFNCVISNRVNISAEMPTICQNNTANTVPMVDANAQYIGYGTALSTTSINIGPAITPDTILTVNSNTGAPVASSAIGGTAQLHLVAPDTTIGGTAADVYGAQGVYANRHSSGTQASKTASAAATQTFGFAAQHWDTTAYFTSAGIDFGTISLQSTTDHSGFLRVRTVAVGSTTNTERLRVQQGVSIGDTTDPGVGGLRATGAGVQFTALASDTAMVDNTVCVSSTGTLLKGSGASGVCLGTSSARFKHDIVTMGAGLAEIIKLSPKNFFYNKGYGDDGKRQQYGFIAEEVAKVFPGVTAPDKDGKPQSVDMLAMVPVLVKAVQELKAANDNLAAEVRVLKAGGKR